MTGQTAWKIFSDPFNLEVKITEGKGRSGIYSFSISHGPGPNFQPMIAGGLSAKNAGEAIEKVKIFLESIRRLIPQQSDHQSKFLNRDIINRVVEELQKNREVRTSKF